MFLLQISQDSSFDGKTYSVVNSLTGRSGWDRVRRTCEIRRSEYATMELRKTVTRHLAGSNPARGKGTRPLESN